MAIANAHAQCQVAFEGLVGASKFDLGDSGVEPEEIHELFGKYKLWAGNVGAVHYGKRYEISLDYRLREATLFRDQVLQILGTLTEKVTSATSLMQGLRAPFEERQPELDDDLTSVTSSIDASSLTRDGTNDGTDESDSPWDISSNSSGASRNSSRKQQVLDFSNTGKLTTTNTLPNVSDGSKISAHRPGMVLEKEMPQLIKSITLAITALYRMPIRKTAPFDRLKNKDLLEFSCYQHFDVMYVKDKFPGLDVSVANRLGKSITKRRQIIYYRSTHATNLASSKDHISMPLSTKPATKMSEMMADSGTQSFDAPPSVSASSKFTLRSKATTFKFGQSLLPDLQESIEPVALYPPSEAESRVSAVSSYAGKDLEVDVPSRPKGEDGKELELFECPYCMLTKNITSHRKWKKHVLEDLQPYLCTHGPCQLGDHIFASKNEWNQHEALYHRVKWFCNTNNHLQYEKQDEFFLHMKQDHQTMLDGARLATSGDIFRQPSRSNEGTCNLCLRYSTKLKGHVARHLEQIAVFALPRVNTESGSVEAERRSRSSRRLRSKDGVSADEDGDSLSSSASVAIDAYKGWTIGHEEKRLSDLCFDEIDIRNIGYVTTTQAREYMQSTYDTSMLSYESWVQIFDLALLRGANGLDRDEFATALHLIKGKIMDPDREVPAVLPRALIPPTLRDRVDQSHEETDVEEAISEHVIVPDVEVPNWDGITNKFSKARQGDAEAPPPELSSREVTEFKPYSDWATHYGIRKEDLVDRSKKEIERQNMIYEFMDREYNGLVSLGVLLKLYRNGLRDATPSIISPKRLASFDERVFGKVNAVEEVDAKLLRQLLDRQREQGPWVVGLSDLIREFVRYSRKAYIEYVAAYPEAAYLMQRESNRNMLFRSFLDQCRNNQASNRLTWDHYLKLPISRNQRRCLILEVMHKKSKIEDEETTNLVKAIDELKALIQACDKRLSAAQQRVDLEDLNNRLKFRQGMTEIDLKLNHLGRQLVHRGDLLRMGTKSVSMIETVAFLFDHYLVFAKPIRPRSDNDMFLGGELYDVSRPPIPLDLLTMDELNIAPVIRSTIRGGTRQISPGDDEKTFLYPFTFCHLGQANYRFFASSVQSRREWVEMTIAALRNHASALKAQNVEPCHINVLADAAFALPYPTVSRDNIFVAETPLYKALRQFDQSNSGRVNGPQILSKASCATSVKHPDGSGDVLLVGTDDGVYTFRTRQDRPWRQVLDAPEVSQIVYLQEGHLLIFLSGESILAYQIDFDTDDAFKLGDLVILHRQPQIPQKISGSDHVLYVTNSNLRNQNLLIYAIRQSRLSTTFKVLQSIPPHKTTKRRSFLNLGRMASTIEYFRTYDEFYLPCDTYKIISLKSSIVVANSKGFEILTLDKKVSWSIPDLRDEAVKNIASYIYDQRPLNMFRLKNEFLLCYERSALYVDRHGDISRSVVMEFCSVAQSAAMQGDHLFLFHEDFVEIRNAENGKLKQVIKGNNIKCLDENPDGDGTVKFSMQHPEAPRTQLVLELIPSEDSTIGLSNEDFDEATRTAAGDNVIDASKPQTFGGRLAQRFITRRSTKEVPSPEEFQKSLESIRIIAEQEQPEYEPRTDAIKGGSALLRSNATARRKSQADESASSDMPRDHSWDD